MLILNAGAAGESKVSFTRSITSLRKHIVRGGNAHDRDTYFKHCASENVGPHQLVINPSSDDDTR